MSPPPDVDETTWMRVARQCDYATFFHTPMWERAVLDAYPRYRGSTFQAELESGALAVYPLLEVRRHLNGVARTYVSTFGSCYGGPIATGPISSADNARMHDLLSKWNTLQIEVTGNPLAPSWEPPGAARNPSDFTHILTLDSGFTDLAQRFAKDHRHAIARAPRKGVTVRLASGLSEWERYFQLYQTAILHWGERATSSYPWRLFHSLFLMAQAHPQNVRLWTAQKDGCVIAGALMFYWNSHAVYWHAAIDRQHAGLAPAKPLLAAAIEDACSEGYRYFDFNPSGGHSSVATFKSRFGAQAWPVARFRLERAPLRGARYVRRLIAS